MVEATAVAVWVVLEVIAVVAMVVIGSLWLRNRGRQDRREDALRYRHSAAALLAFALLIAARLATHAT